RIEGGHDDRRVPVPALALAAFQPLRRQRRDRLPLERREIDTVRAPFLRLDEGDARIDGIDPCVEAVAAADVEAVEVRDAGPQPCCARHAPMAVVLQAAADDVRMLHAGADLVELADREVVAEQPRLAAVPRNRHAAVAADDQVVRVVGIDPQRVILGVHGAEDVAKVPAAVVRDVEPAIRSEEVYAVAILRVDADLAVVHGPRIQRRPQLPRVAGVAAAVHAAVPARGFDDGIDNARIAAEDVEADASLVAGRQAVLQLGPGRAAVARSEDRAARSAAVEAPGFSLPLIRRSEERLRVLRIDDQIGCAGVVVDVQPLAPRLPAVDRLEYTALGVGAPQMSDGRDVHDVGVRWVNDDAADVPRVGEARCFPVAAAVTGLVDAVAPRRTL